MDEERDTHRDSKSRIVSTCEGSDFGAEPRESTPVSDTTQVETEEASYSLPPSGLHFYLLLLFPLQAQGVRG